MKIVLKLILALLLLLCLAPMPYGYYQLVRVIAMVVFEIIAYRYYKSNRIILCIIFISLALLFQPFIKVALGRVMWNVVDVVVAIGLVVLCLIEGKDK